MTEEKTVTQTHLCQRWIPHRVTLHSHTVCIHYLHLDLSSWSSEFLNVKPIVLYQFDASRTRQCWIYSFRLLPLVLPRVREDECWNINNSTHFLVTKSWHIIFSLPDAWVSRTKHNNRYLEVRCWMMKWRSRSSGFTSALSLLHFFFFKVSDEFYFNLLWCA